MNGDSHSVDSAVMIVGDGVSVTAGDVSSLVSTGNVTLSTAADVSNGDVTSDGQQQQLVNAVSVDTPVQVRTAWFEYKLDLE